MSRKRNQIAPPNRHNSTQERRALNQKAFIDVMGDPTAVPEPADGLYMTLRKRSDIPAVQNDFDMGRPTGNRAAPSKDDFFIDVENAVKTIIDDKEALKNFWDFYIIGDTESLSGPQRSRLEQRIGQLFRAQRIWPVRKYFTNVRRPAGCKQSERRHPNLGNR